MPFYAWGCHPEFDVRTKLIGRASNILACRRVPKPFKRCNYSDSMIGIILALARIDCESLNRHGTGTLECHPNAEEGVVIPLQLLLMRVKKGRFSMHLELKN